MDKGKEPIKTSDLTSPNSDDLNSKIEETGSRGN